MRSNTVYSEEKEAYTTFRIMESKRINTSKEKVIQKIIGAACFLVGFFEIVAGYYNLIDEGGIFIFMIPLGIYLVSNKKQVI